MRVKLPYTKLLVAAIGCSPATINPATAPAPNIYTSTTEELTCRAQQPDLSIGYVVYLKGKATLNGSTSLGTRVALRHGDHIATASDGFVAIELLNGDMISISPSSSVVAHCNAAASKAADDAVEAGKYSIADAHMSGGIRG